MKTKEKIILTVLVSLFGLFSWLLGRQQTEVQTIKRTERITVDHYLTDVKFDTMYFNRYDTVRLHKIDTIDCVDSVFVEVPISKYQYDTIVDSCRLTASLSGFNVSFDSLHIQYPKSVYTSLILEPRRKWHWGCGFAIGFGYVK